MPKVYETAEFEKECKKLSKKQRIQIKKLKDGLSKTFNVGKILKYPFLREKKIQERRVYFLIYEEYGSVLLITMSSKKAQQSTIDKIAELLPEFKELMKKII